MRFAGQKVVITGAAFPYLCRQRGPELGRAGTTVMTATLTIVAPLCLGLALFADHLVLLGDKWSPGVPAVAWLAGANWAHSANNTRRSQFREPVTLVVCAAHGTLLR